MRRSGLMESGWTGIRPRFMCSRTAFTMDWESLKIGPETALTPKEREDSAHKSDEEINDL